MIAKCPLWPPCLTASPSVLALASKGGGVGKPRFFRSFKSSIQVKFGFCLNDAKGPQQNRDLPNLIKFLSWWPFWVRCPPLLTLYETLMDRIINCLLSKSLRFGISPGRTFRLMEQVSRSIMQNHTRSDQKTQQNFRPFVATCTLAYVAATLFPYLFLNPTVDIP